MTDDGQTRRLRRRLRIPPTLGDFSLRAYMRTRGFWLRVLFGIALIVLARYTNLGFLGWGLFVSFAVLMTPIKRARSFVFAFMPYATAWFVFTALRSLADETVLAETLNTKVFSFERWLFNGQIPTIQLQDRFYDPNNLQWYDFFFTFVHWSYFLVPHAVAVILWYKSPVRFRHYLSALTLLLAVGLAIYFLIPSNPPWMAPEPINSPAAAPVYRVMEQVAKQIGGGLYEASYNVIGESNPIAAMPSMHMAATFILVFPAWYAGRRWFTVALVYSFLMGLTLVYTGEHYVIDVVIGSLAATYGWFAAGTWIRVMAPLLRTHFAVAARNAASGPRPNPAD
jgi:hypothetical protein